MNEDFRLDLPAVDVDPVTAARQGDRARTVLASAVTPGARAQAAHAVRRLEPVAAGVAAAVYTVWALGRAVLG